MERESDKENIQIANIQSQGATLVFDSFLANFGLLLTIKKRANIDLEYFRISEIVPLNSIQFLMFYLTQFKFIF